MKEAKSTAAIKSLVMQSLESLPLPRSDDVIDDVFLAIEMNPLWKKRYDDLCIKYDELHPRPGRHTVNTWGAYWISNAVDRIGISTCHSPKSTLIKSYSKLDRPAPPRKGNKGKNATEDEAGKVVFGYYKANKATLPKTIGNLRDEIAELVMEGHSPEDAFATAISLEADGQ